MSTSSIDDKSQHRGQDWDGKRNGLSEEGTCEDSDLR